MLRAKGFYAHPEGPPPPPEDGLPTDTAVYWCVRTMQTIGPDSDLVHRSLCVPGRSCFEAPDV